MATRNWSWYWIRDSRLGTEIWAWGNHIESQQNSQAGKKGGNLRRGLWLWTGSSTQHLRRHRCLISKAIQTPCLLRLWSLVRGPHIWATCTLLLKPLVLFCLAAILLAEPFLQFHTLSITASSDSHPGHLCGPQPSMASSAFPLSWSGRIARNSYSPLFSDLYTLLSIPCFMIKKNNFLCLELGNGKCIRTYRIYIFSINVSPRVM